MGSTLLWATISIRINVVAIGFNNDRFYRLGLVDEKNKLRSGEQMAVGGRPIPGARKIKFQELKLIESYLKTLDQKASYEKSEFASITVCTDKASIPLVKEKIRKFRRQMDRYMSTRSVDKNEVYLFTTYLMPLT